MNLNEHYGWKKYINLLPFILIYLNSFTLNQNSIPEQKQTHRSSKRRPELLGEFQTQKQEKSVNVNVDVSDAFGRETKIYLILSLI